MKQNKRTMPEKISQTFMSKTIKLSAVACLVASAINPAFAASFSGVVVDEATNTPVASAKVHIHGRADWVKTDRNGRFSIDAEQSDKLHITADRFKDLEIPVSTLAASGKVQLTKGDIETIVITASGLHQTSLEMATPVSVLAEDQLKTQSKGTLGETLKSEPGINSSYFGPVSASPIIRGMDGPRVKILQNGMDSGDVSRVGPDHAVATESIVTQQIEVLRGPATLLYGSGAIGGVVNVVDNRIPTQVFEGVEGVAELKYDDVSNEKLAATSIDFGQGDFAFHLDAFKRKTNDYEIPGITSHEEHDDHEEDEEDHEEHETSTDILANSDVDADGFNVGGSWITDKGYFGISFGQLNNDYGIPGHAHGEEHHDDDHEEDDHDDDEHHEEEEHAAERVYAALEQDRWQMAGAIYNPFSNIESLSFRASYTDYEHTEFENGEAGTSFSNETTESRITLEHAVIGGWHGVFGYHYSESDYTATGAEAFTPANETKSHAFFLLEEQELFLSNDQTVNLQFGARVEKTDIDASELLLENVEDPLTTSFDYDNTNLSLSAGAVWHYQPGYSVSVALSRAERSPNAAELLSNGLHISTNAFELGALYDVEEDGHIVFNNQNPEEEVANNIDISWRKYTGDVTWSFNAFYNKIDDYYYQADTGFEFEEDGHDHHEEESADGHEDDHEEESHIPILVFRSDDADLYGFEADVNWQINPSWSTRLVTDYVRADLDSGEDLPRIPPLRIRSTLLYEADNWNTELAVDFYDRQDKTGPEESETASYALLGLTMNYFTEVAGNEVIVYFRGENLTDKLARVHSSFIKEQAPLPGRSLSLGMRIWF